MLDSALLNIEFELNDAHALMLSCLELFIYNYTHKHINLKKAL